MEWLLASISPIAIAIFIFYFERGQKKRDGVADERARARKRESLLSMKMQLGTAKLAYATAMAWKRGYPNGEVEEGITAYEEAKKEYFDFMNEQATEHLAI